jgi:hypothetical protein
MNKLLILLIFVGCSTFNKSEQLSDSAKEIPSWVYSPYDVCEESKELCATGEARTFAEADAASKANLASIFQVQIKSELNSFTSSNQAYPWQTAVGQEVQMSLQQSVDQVLETVQVKRRFKKEGLVYSLASLDRIKASELVGQRLSLLDSEIEILWKRKQRTGLRKITRLTLEREKLNERFSLLSGSGKPSSVSYQEVLSWRDSRPQSEPIALRIGHAPEWMIEKIRELLTEAGFRVVKGDTDKVLEVNVDSIKEFLNVQGFEKYTFSLNLSSAEKGLKKKELNASETVTGRNQSDALLKVKNYFNQYLEQHISDLHLD